jgi:multiple sugar transport system substrate-binding protein
MPVRLTRRSVVTGLGSGAVAFAAACRPTAPAPAQEGAPKKVSGTIVWFVRNNPPELEWEEQGAIPAFRQRFPEVTIELVPTPNAEFDTKLFSLISAGTPPDLWTHWGTAGFGDYHARGLLEDLTPLVTRDKLDLSQYMPPTQDVWKRDGKIYALSFNQRFGCFIFYNRDLFDKHSLKYPPADWDDRSWTWERMVEAARAISSGDGAQRNFGVQFAGASAYWAIAYIFGGDFFMPEHYTTGLATTSKADSPEVIQAVQERADLTHRHRVWPTSEEIRAAGISGNLFMSGRLGMIYDGGWGWVNYITAPFRIGAAPAPWVRDNKTTNYINPWMMSVEARNKPATWEFIKWHISEEGQRVLVEYKFQPVLKSALDNWLKQAEKWGAPEELRKLTEGGTRKGILSPNQTFVEYNRLAQAAFAHLDQVQAGTRGAADACRAVKAEWDVLLKEISAQYGKK